MTGSRPGYGVSKPIQEVHGKIHRSKIRKDVLKYERLVTIDGLSSSMRKKVLRPMVESSPYLSSSTRSSGPILNPHVDLEIGKSTSLMGTD